MKKILLLVFSVFLFVGCEALDNTPTKRVEKLLDNYKMKDETVLTQLDTVVDKDATLSTEQKVSYKEAMKRQYGDLNYQVKEEKIDGNNAIVTVEVEVYDYNKVKTDADEYLVAHPDEFKDTAGVYDDVAFMTYKLGEMTKTTNKIKYTIDFRVTKTDGKWAVEDLSETDRQKIHGLYVS